MTCSSAVDEGWAERTRTFVQREVDPGAAAWDVDGRFPADIVRRMGSLGFCGLLAPAAHGGSDVDAASFGRVCEELGRGCASARSLLTVHSMVVAAVRRWGDAALKAEWLPRLATGDVLAALALSEPQAGSDASALATIAIQTGDEYRLSGMKHWITFGQMADVFMVFARGDVGITAFLVDRHTPGVDVVPVPPPAGCRASMLAELRFTDTPARHVVGPPGAGWAWVGSTALDCGRYSVAWGCVGLAQACLDASMHHASQRHQFGQPLRAFQLVQEMLADMITNVRAARLLCLDAARLRDNHDPTSILATNIAKYFASRTASRVAGDAVQVHGAKGLAADAAVQRHWRDAKVMELIEGSNQIHQVLIAQAALGASSCGTAGQ